MNRKNASCWIVSDGKAGMENSCLGLAKYMGLLPIVKRIKLRFPFKQIVPFWRKGLKYAFRKDGDSVNAPFPDILIACGRASTAASLFVKKESLRYPEINNGKGTFTVQIQNPYIDKKLFDLIVTPKHDLLGKHSNVIETMGGLHKLCSEDLRAAADEFVSLRYSEFKNAQEFKASSKPIVSVLIGGSNAIYKLEKDEILLLANQLKAIALTGKYSLMITPSRRTGEENIAILKRVLDDCGVYIWDMQGENPYFAMLELADYILVTSDSVNMITEACSCGKPVMIIPLKGGSKKFARFHKLLLDNNYARVFRGDIEDFSNNSCNEMPIIAEAVWKAYDLFAKSIVKRK